MAVHYKTMSIKKGEFGSFKPIDERLTEMRKDGAIPVYFKETDEWVRITFEINDK